MLVKLLSTILIALAMSVSAAAGDDKDSKKEEKAFNYNSMSTAKLRKHRDKAAEEFYEAFNSLNDQDEFMVRCDYQRPTGSRRKTHVCQAKFVSDIQTEHAERNWDNRMDSTGNNVSTKLEEKAEQFQNKLSELVGANPELAEKLAHYNGLVTMVSERGK
ncbi:MAG: hypothetical protein AAGI27_14710 [Pseudomonadota bacterium]